MTIEVTGCHDCLFAECDYESKLDHWCNHFGLKGDIFNVEPNVYFSDFHKDCPLQTESITIKKKDNDSNSKR